MSQETTCPGVETDPISVSGAVSDPLQRRILDVLGDVDARLSVADLARELARRDTDDRSGDPNWQQVRQYHVMLYHVHVPKLAAAGLVDFDVDERTVAPAAALADDEVSV